jgi:molybdenum cofactor cytidylyltransferase
VLAVAILAAGQSKRLGRNKASIVYQGQSLLHRALQLARAMQAKVIFLTHSDTLAGNEMERACGVARAQLHLLPVANASSGMSASLRAVASACLQQPDLRAVLVLLIDQYRVDAPWLTAMIELWQAEPECALASAFDGILGAPAILPRSWFLELQALSGDQGARQLLRTRSDVRIFQAPESPGDLDTQAQLRALLAGCRA